MPHESLFLIVFAGYAASFVAYFTNFELQDSRLSVWGARIAASSLAMHFALLAALLVSGNAPFLVRHWQYGFSFVVLAASFVIERRYGARYLMLFSLPIVLALSLLALVVARGSESPFVPRDAWLWLHTGFLWSGMTGLVTAVSCALMYLIQSAQLKSRHPGRSLSKLPSLKTLDRIHFIALGWGVVLFSLGILCGVLWASNLNSLSAAVRDPKVILSFLTCFMYWLVLSFRLSSWRRGQKIAAGTVVVFALVVLTLFSTHAMPGFVGAR